MPDVNKLKFDIDIIETLSEAETAYDFFITCDDLFEDAVDVLIQNVFRKDDYAVKFAVEPLLNNEGPLAKLPIRLKLLFGLGLLSNDSYHDIEKFIELKEFVQEDNELIEFNSPLILQRLYTIEAVASVLPENIGANEIEQSSHYIVQMQQNQNKQKIKSALILAITELIKELHRDTPLS